jgi:hypothetical protein
MSSSVVDLRSDASRWQATPPQALRVGRALRGAGHAAGRPALRQATLREAEETTDKGVSTADSSQLERGKLEKPSPNLMHSLVEVYVVPYEALRERAGYLLLSQSHGCRPTRLAASAIDDLTAEEEEELSKYLAFGRFKASS